MKKAGYVVFALMAVALCVGALAAWKMPLAVTLDRTLRIEDNGGVILTMTIGPFKRVRELWFSNTADVDIYIRQLRHNPRVDLKFE